MVNILLNGANGNMGKALCEYIKDSVNFSLLYGIDKDNSVYIINLQKSQM